MTARRAVLVLAAVSLAGCAASPVYNVPPPAGGGQQSGQGAAVPDAASAASDDAGGAGVEVPVSPPVSAAAANLVGTSRDQRNAGNLTGAAATLERALTIAPDEALLWIELAEIRLAQGDVTTAEEMARKAMTLTNEGTPVYERARRILRR